MAKLPTVRMHPPALLSPFQHISGAAHPSLLPAGKGCDAADTANGKLLGERDAARAKSGQRVIVPAFVDTAGICYKRGYLQGLSKPGITISGTSRNGLVVIYPYPFPDTLMYAGAGVHYR